MKIVEKVRSVQDPSHAPTRMIRRTPVPAESEVDVLTRQLRRATERNTAEFDRGFQAAILLVAHGADLDRLKEASGVVAGEWEDTAPCEMLWSGVDPLEHTQPVACDDFTRVWDQEDTAVESPRFALGPESR